VGSLQFLAEIIGRTKTYHVRKTILEHLDDLEDLYEQRSLDIRNDEETISIEDVMKGYGWSLTKKAKKGL